VLNKNICLKLNFFISDQAPLTQSHFLHLDPHHFSMLCRTLRFLALVCIVSAERPKICNLGSSDKFCTVTEPTLCPGNPLEGLPSRNRFGCKILDLRIRVSNGTNKPLLSATNNASSSQQFGLLVRFCKLLA
jgi:hypothetical protein